MIVAGEASGDLHGADLARELLALDSSLSLSGIGGAGMSGIAEVFHNLGYVISGSDIAEGSMVRHLRDLGIKIHIGLLNR